MAAKEHIKGRVLVTGATGFIGRNLCEKLVATGSDVYAITRNEHSLALPAGAKIVTANLKDQSAIQEVINSIKPDFVYHLAGLVDSSKGLEMVMTTLQNNLMATVNLFIALTMVGCHRVIFASSSDSGNTSNSVAANSPYAVSKEAAALYAQMFRRVFSLPVTTARIFLGYGPNQSAQKLIPHIINSILRNEPPWLHQGERTCDFIHVDDISAGLLKMAAVDGLEGETVDLGTGIGVTISEVAHYIAELLSNSTEIEFVDAGQNIPPVILADTERTYRLLNFRPQWELRQGLEDTIQWYSDRFQG